jgi:galactitol-specific phosphotransferase system IIB component
MVTLLLIGAMPFFLLQAMFLIGEALGQASSKTIKRHYRKSLKEKGQEESMAQLDMHIASVKSQLDMLIAQRHVMNKKPRI